MLLHLKLAFILNKLKDEPSYNCHPTIKLWIETLFKRVERSLKASSAVIKNVKPNHAEMARVMNLNGGNYDNDLTEVQLQDKLSNEVKISSYKAIELNKYNKKGRYYGNYTRSNYYNKYTPYQKNKNTNMNKKFFCEKCGTNWSHDTNTCKYRTEFKQ